MRRIWRVSNWLTRWLHLTRPAHVYTCRQYDGRHSCSCRLPLTTHISLSCCWGSRATLCVTASVLWTKMDAAQCDKLTTGRTDIWQQSTGHGEKNGKWVRPNSEFGWRVQRTVPLLVELSDSQGKLPMSWVQRNCCDRTPALLWQTDGRTDKSRHRIAR